MIHYSPCEFVSVCLCVIMEIYGPEDNLLAQKYCSEYFGICLCTSQLRDYNHWQVKLIALEPLCVHCVRFNLTHNTSLNIVADWAPLSLLPGGTVRQCDAPTPKNYSRTAQRTSHRGLDLASNSKVLIRLSIYKNISPGKIPIYRNLPNLAARMSQSQTPQDILQRSPVFAPICQSCFGVPKGTVTIIRL